MSTSTRSIIYDNMMKKEPDELETQLDKLLESENKFETLINDEKAQLDTLDQLKKSGQIIEEQKYDWLKFDLAKNIENLKQTKIGIDVTKQVIQEKTPLPSAEPSASSSSAVPAPLPVQAVQPTLPVHRTVYDLTKEELIEKMKKNRNDPDRIKYNAYVNEANQLIQQQKILKQKQQDLSGPFLQTNISKMKKNQQEIIKLQKQIEILAPYIEQLAIEYNQYKHALEMKKEKGISYEEPPIEAARTQPSIPPIIQNIDPFTVNPGALNNEQRFAFCKLFEKDMK